MFSLTLPLAATVQQVGQPALSFDLPGPVSSKLGRHEGQGRQVLSILFVVVCLTLAIRN
ncbi:MAG: hypothetical protein MZW92_44415 [Comamonadaceae bacterium]|nr:hypothetical protein [Comamonadaceae bacterium]